MDKGFQKVSMRSHKLPSCWTRPCTLFDTGTLKNSVNQASDFQRRQAGL